MQLKQQTSGHNNIPLLGVHGYSQIVGNNSNKISVEQKHKQMKFGYHSFLCTPVCNAKHSGLLLPALDSKQLDWSFSTLVNSMGKLVCKNDVTIKCGCQN